jgi:dienelactone hydrolase
LVITTAAPQGANPPRATVEDLKAALDWSQAEATRKDSPLAGKIDKAHVAVMGVSCGGFLTVGLSSDPRVSTIGVFNSGVQPPGPKASGASFPTTEALAKLHGPVLVINGHERDLMMKTSAENFALINHVPVFYGARHNAGHTATVFHPGGGEFANVASNWLLYQFKGDKDAAKIFVGKDCGLCTNPDWDTDSKRLD